MNIYFPPIENSELHFPTSNLSINITNSLLTIDDLKEKSPDVEAIQNEKDGEISDFYKKYKTKTLDKTSAQRKLNKIKVYLIVKSKIVKGKQVNYAIPIRNYDDLGHSIVERSKSFIASLFYVRLNNEGSTALRPFVLDHLMSTVAPFGAEEEIPLKSLILPNKYGVDGIKLPIPSDIESISEDGYFDESVGGPFSAEYDYDYSMVDNTFFLNVSRYITDFRYKKPFDINSEKPNLLKQIKEINIKEDFFKLFNVSNFVEFVLGNKSPVMEKNIIPVFSKLEDAQDLLITVLEEINQPFEARRQIETSNTPKYYRSLDYLDDSFTFQNRYFLPDPTDRGDVITDFLRRYRFIKPRNNRSYDNYYNENNYQIKGPFFVDDIETNQDLDEYVPMSQRPKFAPKNIWRENDYWTFSRLYFPGQLHDYSWWETRDLTDAEKGLLTKSQDVKIVSMGLSDFLEFWNNPKTKNADVLFIPALDKSIKRKVPILSNRKSRDRLYDYQQKFRGSKKQDIDNYNYEIKISS